MNPQLVTLWDDIAESIRYQERSKDELSPVEFPDHINDLDMFVEGELYPIYINGPVGTIVTATLDGGGVTKRPVPLMRVVAV